MTHSDRSLPPLLAALHALKHQIDVDADNRPEDDDDDSDDERIDYEAYPEFESAARTESWIQAWTGNKALTGAEFRVFGQDGTGGLVALWSIDPDAGLLAQPVVFFGSEGELGVIAVDLADFVWLFAGGFGPYEAVACPNSQPTPSAAYTEFAATHAAAQRKSAHEVIARARAKFGARFEAEVRALCQ